MYTSLVFLVLFLILMIFPLAHSIYKNIRMFLSFIISFLMTFLLRLAFPKGRDNFITFLVDKLYVKGASYFASIPLEKQIALQHIRFILFFLIFIILYFVFYLIFRFLIKEKSPFIGGHSFNYHVIKILLKVFNIIFIAAAVSFGVQGFSPIWHFYDGFLSRFFEFLESVVISV